jgi:hypothetical protein
VEFTGEGGTRDQRDPEQQRSSRSCSRVLSTAGGDHARHEDLVCRRGQLDGRVHQGWWFDGERKGLLVFFF